MSKILAVFGATGQQGGSVVDFVLNDHELSKQYTIRALTRDISSANSQSLASRDVEVVAADVNNAESLPPALKGAHTVFAMTAPSFTDIKASEVRQGYAIVDAAIAENVQYLIFSTLPNVTKISDGKYTKVEGFDGKAEVEEYIRKQPIKSAFFAPGSFMQNYHQIMKPKPAGDGTYMITRHMDPKARLPMIDIVGDTGKYVGAILAEPDEHEGKTFCAATKLYSIEEQAEILSTYTGKKVIYKPVPTNTYRSFLPPAYAEGLVEMMSYQQDFGYYGAETEELVQWAADNARGKLTTFEGYLERNPMVLE